MRPLVRKGDLVFVVSTGWISKLILWGSGPKSQVSHVAIVVDDQGGIVEANPSGVELTNLWDRYSTSKHQVAIYRPINITQTAREQLAWEAQRHVGRKYAFLSLVQQLVDRKLLGGKMVLRRVNLPFVEICSEVVAEVYSTQGLNFGLPPAAASPQEMFEFCKREWEKYAKVLSLGPLER